MSSKVKYAVIKNGSTQARIAEGQKLVIDRVAGEKGDKITISDVLMLSSGDDGSSIVCGLPTVKGASVSATIVGHTMGKKVIVFKKKRRKGYTKKQGHRQKFTEVVIDGIKVA